MKLRTSINIAGDFYINPSRADQQYFNRDILDLFQSTDFNIVNLESPVTRGGGYKIEKSGPYLSISEKALDHLCTLKVSAVTIANNHILDYGNSGLKNTLHSCDARGIQCVGAGETLEEARKPLILHGDGASLAIINVTEHEWSVSEGLKAGANPYDIPGIIHQIEQVKQQSDFVIMIIHGGQERYNLPSPRMVSQYRFLAEHGASVIIGHHTHCMSGYEVHKNVPIFYSLGNFLFTMDSDLKSSRIGAVLNLSFVKDQQIEFSLIPVVQAEKSYELSRISELERTDIESDIKKLNNIIADSERLLQSWDEFAQSYQDHVMYIFSPINLIRSRFLRSVLRKLKLDKLFMRKKHYMEMLNYIQCESLAELSVAALKKHLLKDENCNK